MVIYIHRNNDYELVYQFYCNSKTGYADWKTLARVRRGEGEGIEFSNTVEEEWNSGQGRVAYEILATMVKQNFIYGILYFGN